MQVMKDDIVEMITLKSLLFSLDEEECLEKCDSFQAYEDFLYDTSILLTLEPDFFLLDKDYMEKVRKVIYSYRFKFHTSDLIFTSNQIIVALNHLEQLTSDQVDSRVKEYVDFQEEARKISFSDMDNLILANIYDLVSYQAFSGKVDDKLSPMLIYSSLNYFASCYPILFSDTSFFARADGYINDRMKRNTIFQRKENLYAKETKENIQKVKRNLT